jgi:hypothetical protein
MEFVDVELFNVLLLFFKLVDVVLVGAVSMLIFCWYCFLVFFCWYCFLVFFRYCTNFSYG